MGGGGVYGILNRRYSKQWSCLEFGTIIIVRLGDIVSSLRGDLCVLGIRHSNKIPEYTIQKRNLFPSGFQRMQLCYTDPGDMGLCQTEHLNMEGMEEQNF